MYDYNKRISLPMMLFIRQLILGYQVKKKNGCKSSKLQSQDKGVYVGNGKL